MSRPTEWSAVALIADPVPGDPGVVRQGGSDYLEVAEAIRAARTSLATMELPGRTESEAVDALLATASAVAVNIAKAEKRYQSTGQALSDYAPKLASAQEESALALESARTAREVHDYEDGRRRHYLNLAYESADAGQVMRYHDLALSHEVEAAGAAALIDDATGRVHEAVRVRDVAAEAAKDKIQEIAGSDGLRDSWWDDWGKSLLRSITDIAGTVAAIAGILALLVCWIPVVGQALAGVLLLVSGIAAAINAIGAIVLAATGDRSWTDAIISIIGALLACLGLSALSRVGNLDKATRINKLAALEPGGDSAQALTKLQAFKIKPKIMDESMRLWNSPVADLQNGDHILRAIGGNSWRGGASYTTMDPRLVNAFRRLLGLPNKNTATRLVEARIDDISRLVLKRHALPFNGNPGGAPEYLFAGPFGSEKGVYYIRSSRLRG